MAGLKHRSVGRLSNRAYRAAFREKDLGLVWGKYGRITNGHDLTFSKNTFQGHLISACPHDIRESPYCGDSVRVDGPPVDIFLFRVFLGFPVGRLGPLA